MTWQDVVISGVNFVFGAALLPSIFRPEKPHYLTSLLTAVGLTVLCITFATLDLILSSIGIATGCLGWWILTGQGVWKRYKITRKE